VVAKVDEESVVSESELSLEELEELDFLAPNLVECFLCLCSFFLHGSHDDEEEEEVVVWHGLHVLVEVSHEVLEEHEVDEEEHGLHVLVEVSHEVDEEESATLTSTLASATKTPLQLSQSLTSIQCLP
jgi:hypothetical protein